MLVKDYFTTPTTWPGNLPMTIACSAAETVASLRKKFGSLQRVSAPEVGHAVLRAIADAIRSGAPGDVLE